MSLTSRLLSQTASVWALKTTPWAAIVESTLNYPIRGKKSRGGGSTKNKCGHPKGKKRGMKVFDGQRVPKYSILHRQLKMEILPGWNVSVFGMRNLSSSVPGRVMLTMERCDFGPFDRSIKWENEENFPDRLQGKAVFRPHLHIIPDTQHQYFKLIEQV